MMARSTTVMSRKLTSCMFFTTIWWVVFVTPAGVSLWITSTPMVLYSLSNLTFLSLTRKTMVPSAACTPKPVQVLTDLVLFLKQLGLLPS